ncbi:MAG: hypothetical protein PVS2B1_07670 [Candidatus Dormibacteraceae bacterium]
MTGDLRDFPLRRGVQPPLEHIATDHGRARDLSFRALLRGPDVDQQRTIGQLAGGLLRVNPDQLSPRPIQQLIGGEWDHGSSRRACTAH